MRIATVAFDVHLSCPRGLRPDHAPRTQGQSFHTYLTYGRTYQAQRREPHLCRHASHLAVLPLMYRELNPRSRDFRSIADRRIAPPQLLRLLDETSARGLRREVAETHALA